MGLCYNRVRTVFMKNIVIILLVIIIFAGGGAFFLSQNSNVLVGQSVTPTPDYEQIAMMTMYPSGTPVENAKTAGQYMRHSQNILSTVKGKKVVLFFYANWCPTCIPADKDFTKNISKIPGDVILIRVNYNDNETDKEEKALAQKYGVIYQHTYVQIDADGREVTKWNGGQTEELLTNLK